MTKIGDRLYTSPYGRPERVGEEHQEITGETRFSWLVGDPNYKRDKVDKKTMLEAIPGYGYRRWFTVQDLHEEVWRKKYRHVISGVVLGERDPKKLKMIADILGMNVEEVNHAGSGVSSDQGAAGTERG